MFAFKAGEPSYALVTFSGCEITKERLSRSLFPGHEEVLARSLLERRFGASTLDKIVLKEDLETWPDFLGRHGVDTGRDDSRRVPALQDSPSASLGAPRPLTEANGATPSERQFRSPNTDQKMLGTAYMLH